MDWDGVIEKNREALKRVLAMLFGMAGMAAGADGSLRCGGGEGVLRRARRIAVLRLLRPAESAVRRLVIVAARGIVVTLPPPRPRKPKPKPKSAFVRDGVGTGIVLSRDALRQHMAARAAERAAARANRMPSLPLVDPLQNPLSLSKGRRRVRYTPPHLAPRVSFLDPSTPYRPLPPPPSPDDMIDAMPLARRLQALSRALDDLPGHARRFARWKARRNRALAQGRRHRLSPMKPGRAPGLSSATSRRPTHEVHEILKDMQYFAREVLEHPDTS